MEVVVTTWAIRGSKLQSNGHHQQTNTPNIYGADSLPDSYLSACLHYTAADWWIVYKTILAV